MKTPMRDRIALWIETIPAVRFLFLKYDGEAPAGTLYVNRINGHVVIVTGLAKGL